jgi:hypothetical protein
VSALVNSETSRTQVRPLLEHEVGDERAGGRLERDVAVAAAEHDDGQAGPLPSPEERRPHQSPLGSIATHGTPASYISSAMTTAALLLPAPFLARMPKVSVTASIGGSRSPPDTPRRAAGRGRHPVGRWRPRPWSANIPALTPPPPPDAPVCTGNSPQHPSCSMPLLSNHARSPSICARRQSTWFRCRVSSFHREIWLHRPPSRTASRAAASASAAASCAPTSGTP